MAIRLEQLNVLDDPPCIGFNIDGGLDVLWQFLLRDTDPDDDDS